MPALKYIGGLLMSLFRRCLKDAMDGACFVSSGRLFHARIVEGKNELIYVCCDRTQLTRHIQLFVIGRVCIFFRTLVGVSSVCE